MMAAAAFLSLAAAGTAFGGEPGWAKEEDGWYYYLADGSLATGWIPVDKAYYFLTDTGLCLTDTMTPDGYYVNGDGAWYRREAQILGCTMSAPEKFVLPDTEWNRSESLAAFQYTIKQVFGGARVLKISDTAMEYVSVSTDGQSSQSAGSGSYWPGSGYGTQNGGSTWPGASSWSGGSSGTGGSTGTKNGGDAVQETVLAGIYREPGAGRYRLDLRMKLDQNRTDGETAATYDYGVFKALLYQISSSPEVLESAIYSAWQGENQWGINRLGWVSVGDCQVTYTAGNGFGRFYIKARGAE